MKILQSFSGSKAVLCIVAETTGSCPGRAGFKMIVSPKGASRGSVGGGAMEFNVITMAREMLDSGESKPQIASFEHTGSAEPGQKSGMICSGNQKIILVPAPSERFDLTGKKWIEITCSGFTLPQNPPLYTGLCVSGKSWKYAEELVTPPTVYIFGGGHCSLALTPVLNSLDMQVVVIDDRSHVWTMDENTEASSKIVSDYHKVAGLIPDTGNALVVIMTASHLGDSIVLRQMLPLNLRYLGMMASKTTAKHILGEMKSLGYSEEELHRVRTPVGISISSRTPAEIAVSIAAEIIHVMNS